ncbi:MAG: SRPBCC domain-containing protein [Candidatus Eisenbacteria bacterium]|nr:SRPBCC domain-containing protein [Candidatus Eisenbacteria bacterium]
MNAAQRPPAPKHYFVRLLGTRPGWPEQMNERESRIMDEHFLYLKDLTAKKKVLMAGPCFANPTFGLMVLSVESEDEARAMIAREPSVVSGVHTYEMSDLRVALLAHHVPADRYAEPASDRILHKEAVVGAPRSDVWGAWTTTEGLRSFFSPRSRVDLRIGGEIEVLFDGDRPYGEQGSEDCRVLSYLPEEMLSFEWNAPAQFGPARDARTHVVLRFEELGGSKTRVLFDHLGWGGGDVWDEVYQYFDRAWSLVLGNLQKRFESGPLDWA